MSWDSYKYERLCPCGKGKVLVTDESDDWGNSRHYEEILCVECREEDDKKRKIKEARNKRYVELTEKVILNFKLKYLNVWSNFFSNVKTKKAVWQILYNFKIEKCCLQTFYKRFNMEKKLEYLESLIVLENIPLIVKSLNIKDIELEKIISEPLEIRNQIKAESIAEYMSKF